MVSLPSAFSERPPFSRVMQHTFTMVNVVSVSSGVSRARVLGKQGDFQLANRVLGPFPLLRITLYFAP